MGYRQSVAVQRPMHASHEDRAGLTIVPIVPWHWAPHRCPPQTDWIYSHKHWRSHGWAPVGTCPPYLGQGRSRDLHKLKEFFLMSRVGLQTPHEPEGTPYIFYEHITKMHLSTADCICISSFWGLCPQTSTGALPLDPAGDFRHPDPLCPPYLQTLATLMLTND